jgi:hypothetical protein
MKVIEFDQAAYDSVMKIVLRENFPEAKRIMSKFNNGEISINQQEAQVIVDVLAYEVSRVCLRYPYNEGDDGYEENDEWNDIVQSVYPSTIAFLTPHFDLTE